MVLHAIDLAVRRKNDGAAEEVGDMTPRGGLLQRPMSDVRCLPELLFKYRRGGDRFGFELLHLRELGFEVRVYKNDVLVITHSFLHRRAALQWAEEGRHVIARSGETETNHAR